MANFRPNAKQASHRPAVPRLLIAAAVLPIATALLASVVMSIRRIWSADLPGCSPGGGCEWAVKSQWSSLLGMPTPFIGMGYFTALLIFWLLTARHGIWRPMLYAVRVGALISIGFSIVMLFLGHFCVWCVTTHVANLTLFALLEISARNCRVRTSNPVREAIVASLICLVIAASMKLLQMRETRLADFVAHKAAEESIAKIGEEEPEQILSESEMTAPAITADAITCPKETRRVFGGRYWTDAENAAVRIVIFHDYRCELCKEVEEPIDRIPANRNDVAVSSKPRPFDKDCNSTILGDNIRPGAGIAANVESAKQLDVQASPTIFINGRTIANRRTPGLMKRIVSHLTGN